MGLLCFPSKDGRKAPTSRVQKEEKTMKPKICMHENCLNCPLLPICEKDENEFDAEKAAEHIKSNHCPKCGTPLLEGVKYLFCLGKVLEVCDYKRALEA